MYICSYILTKEQATPDMHIHMYMYVYRYMYICIYGSPWTSAGVHLHAQVREVGSGASWRTEPLSHADCIMRIQTNRGRVSPLLAAPWVSKDIFRFDWLHVVDLGVASEFIGNFLHEVQELPRRH